MVLKPVYVKALGFVVLRNERKNHMDALFTGN